MGLLPVDQIAHGTRAARGFAGRERAGAGWSFAGVVGVLGRLPSVEVVWWWSIREEGDGRDGVGDLHLRSAGDDEDGPLWPCRTSALDSELLPAGFLAVCLTSSLLFGSFCLLHRISHFSWNKAIKRLSKLPRKNNLNKVASTSEKFYFFLLFYQ
jgi:hypothetical protein